MRRFARLSLAAALLMSTGAAFATSSPIACPAQITASTDLTSTADSGFYAVRLYRGQTLLTSANIGARDGSWVPLSVSRDQSYVSSIKNKVTTTGTVVQITPAVATEGFSIAVRPDPSAGAIKAISYSVSLNSIKNIQSAGPKGSEINVADRQVIGPVCGQVTLAPGETDTFNLAGTDLVMQIERLSPKADKNSTAALRTP